VGLTPVPPDRLAAVVTRLEMRERPRPAPVPPSRLRLARWKLPEADAYRALFRRVGAPWLWYSRLAMTDERLLETIRAPGVEVYAAADGAGTELGFVELAFRGADACELAYFGLVPELVGRGEGRWLMAQVLALAWRPGVAVLGVNTCTLDHPRALPFYRAAGFRAVSRTLETFPDPRLAGLLPPDAAPQIPCLGPSPADNSR